MNDWVFALAVSGRELYAGGDFTTADGSLGSRIAKWNTSSWSALGSGMNNDVYALAVSGSDLYAGAASLRRAGRFQLTWRGLTWSSPLFPSSAPAAM
jgi:hypothetical protein